MTQILQSTVLSSGLFGATNHRGYHDLLYNYCNFGVETANDAQTVWVNTACRKDPSEESIKTDTVVSYQYFNT